MLHHEISGNGKKPLVLLHGFMENTTIWDEMEALLSKDFTLNNKNNFGDLSGNHKLTFVSDDGVSLTGTVNFTKS